MKGVGHDDENDFQTKKLSGNCVRFLLTDFLKNFPRRALAFRGILFFATFVSGRRLLLSYLSMKAE